MRRQRISRLRLNEPRGGREATQQSRLVAGAFAAGRDRRRYRQQTCPCCQGELHRIGEDNSERLDIVPAQFRVLVTVARNTPAGVVKMVSCRLRRPRD